TDEQRDAAIQEVMSRRPPSPPAHEHATDDNDVPRVRNARAVRVSGYDSSESDEDEASMRYVRAVDRGRSDSTPMADVPGARHRAVVAHKAAVYIGDARNRFELHVDGGSPLSMITPQALRSIAPFAEVHPPEPLKIRGYRGDDYQRTIGVVVLPVSFPTTNRVAPVICRFDFHVVTDCTGGWILGVDNMKADGIDARSKMERLEFEKRPDAEVKLLQAKEDPTTPAAHLLCAEDTTIGPRTTRFVKVQGVTEDQIVRPWVFMGKEPESGGAQVPCLDQTVKASSALSKEQQTQLSRMLSSHAVWPTPSRPIGTYEFGEVSLRLKEDQKDWVHSEPPRRTSPAQQRVIDETLAEHDALDISEPSRGPYASGVVLVQQRDKIRFCNDYRPLNKVTVDEYYTMPMTDVVFDRLGKAQYFTVIDLNKGYYQFLLDSASRDLTGFVTFRGLRRYKRMPFGLKSAPAWFQRAMDKTLGATRWEYAIAYLDDVVIFSDTFEDHLRHVDNILASLERAGLTVSPSKCYFGYDSVALLGFRVSSLGLMTDHEKTRAVLQFPEPTTAVEARRFFAMAAWYRRFVVNFASRARPINESFLGDSFVWGERERAAFDDIRQAITHAPVLARPDFDKPFVLAVDASKMGLGGVLSQVDDEGRERPVLFLSRQTTAGEKNYAPTHLELMGVWWCVKKLHHYFDGSEVEVKTDHNALKWLWDLKPAEMFETRVQKFKAALAPLEGKVKVWYAKGKDNVVADALSRAPLPDRDHGEHDVDVCFRAVEFDGSNSRSASVEAERIVRAVSALRVGIDEVDLWEKGYLADPRWRRIWTKAVERGSAMEISGNEEEAVSEDSGSSASEKGSDKEEGEEEGLVIEEGSDEGQEKTDAATKGSGDDVEEGAAVKEQEVADKPQPTHLLPTLPPIRILRPRKVMAVHRGTDDSLFFIQDRLLFVRFGDGTVKLCVPRSKLEQLIHEHHHAI
ncbi:hypothetical protein CF336_g8321, partial [Tilletia laevis]